jgi:hypothetical protein
MIYENGQSLEFLRDGLPMYPNLNANSIYTEVKETDSNKGPSVDEMIPEFVLETESPVIKFFTRLDDVAERVKIDKLEVLGISGGQEQHV